MCPILYAASSSKSQVSALSYLAERSPFTLDTEGGFVHFFKVSDEKKPYQTLSLVGADISPSEDIVLNKETKETRSCFAIQFKQRDGKNKGSPMQAVAEDPAQFQIMKVAFEVSSQKERQTDEQRNSSVANLEDIQKKQAKKVNGMSKVVMTINSVPNILTASTVEVQETKNPSNVFSGLGYGGYAVLKGVFDGVTGIITEPIKGGTQDGFSGVAKGIGRGLLGVVAKPIGGVAGFLQCTV